MAQRRVRKVIDEVELRTLGEIPLAVDSQQGHFKSNRIVNTQAALDVGFVSLGTILSPFL